jgi:hypothetical protein
MVRQAKPEGEDGPPSVGGDDQARRGRHARAAGGLRQRAFNVLPVFSARHERRNHTNARLESYAGGDCRLDEHRIEIPTRDAVADDVVRVGAMDGCSTRTRDEHARHGQRAGGHRLR